MSPYRHDLGPLEPRSTPGITVPFALASGIVIVAILLIAASRSAALPDSPPDVQSSGVPQPAARYSAPLAVAGDPSNGHRSPGQWSAISEGSVRPSGAETAGLGTPSSPAPATGAGSEGAQALTSPTPATIGTALTASKGWASYYDDGPGHYGAVHSWRWGDERYAVQVCLQDRSACTYVMVRDYCACGDRHGEPTVIDLSPAAFRDLAPLSRGIVKVVVKGPVPFSLPATDGGS